MNNGLIVVNKEKNVTSRDVVNSLCKIFNTKKIGHTGTLDPIATGVLVIAIGKYTKLVDKITSLDKEYIAKVKIGIKTDTLDITGNILEKRKCNVDKLLLINTLNSFIGSYSQVVPKYSAIKINGKKLYEYARKNIHIDLPSRKVEIKNIELIDFKTDSFSFKVTVSKGTYIRSLIRDICDKLNIIGTMESLTRTRQGEFKIEGSYTTRDIINNKYKLLTAEDIFDFKTYEITFEEFKKIQNGNMLSLNSKEEYLFLNYQQKKKAIYKKEKDLYKVWFKL